MKSSHKYFSLIAVLLMVLCLSAFQLIERNTDPVIEQEPEPVIDLNPITGTPVANPDLLKLPPIFVPLARYPSAFRPSSGHSQAQWVFEMYIANEESRPVLMFWGDLPTAPGPPFSAWKTCAGSLAVLLSRAGHPNLSWNRIYATWRSGTGRPATSFIRNFR